MAADVVLLTLAPRRPGGASPGLRAGRDRARAGLVAEVAEGAGRGLPSTAVRRRASARWGLNRAGAREGMRRRENRAPSARAAATDAVRPPILNRPREDGGPASGPSGFHRARRSRKKAVGREGRDTRPGLGRRRLTLHESSEAGAVTCPGRARGLPKRRIGNGVPTITECRGMNARGHAYGPGLIAPEPVERGGPTNTAPRARVLREQARDVPRYVSRKAPLKGFPGDDPGVAARPQRADNRGAR